MTDGMSHAIPDAMRDAITYGMGDGKGNSLSPEPCVLMPNVSACIRSTGRGDSRREVNAENGSGCMREEDRR